MGWEGVMQELSHTHLKGSPLANSHVITRCTDQIEKWWDQLVWKNAPDIVVSSLCRAATNVVLIAYWHCRRCPFRVQTRAACCRRNFNESQRKGLLPVPDDGLHRARQARMVMAHSQTVGSWVRELRSLRSQTCCIHHQRSRVLGTRVLVSSRHRRAKNGPRI